GLVVDELVGQQQVVIKSLEANADPVAGVSGATILGDGRVSLILEINDLARLGTPEPTAPMAQAA
ncbi:MAG: chemotaxis protein CheW, partial [Rickettsiales bacterium]